MHDSPHPDRAAELVAISLDLSDALREMQFSAPVHHVYRPLDYAWDIHRRYLETWGGLGAKTLFLGMNPGPYGMAQTGVPFGAVGVTRDWLRLDGAVGPARDPHPKRPVLGFEYPREEVSGKRLWGWARDAWGEPAAFFRQILVHNYCPLLFLDEGGRNLTPDKLVARERADLLPPCDEALRRVVETLGVERVVGVGAWAEGRAKQALAALAAPPALGRVLHPSPASPAANRGWAEAATAQLRAQGVPVPERAGP